MKHKTNNVILYILLLIVILCIGYMIYAVFIYDDTRFSTWVTRDNTDWINTSE